MFVSMEEANNIFKMSKGAVKIKLENNISSSGVLLNFQRNNKQFYCLLTNQFVITPDIINKKQTINILDSKKDKNLLIKLDSKERIIQCFKESLNIDATIIEILEKDGLDDSYFLKPSNVSLETIVNKDIVLFHYPKGNQLSFSQGKIIGINSQNQNEFYHDSSTLEGSSGSPIALRGEKTIIGIHKGTVLNKPKNIGIFIKNIIDRMKNYKKEGE